MKKCLFVSVLLLVACGAGVSVAGDGESGIFFGLGGNILSMDGTGSWDGFDFSIDAPLTIEEGASIGLNWNEKLLFGVKPIVGYRINPSLALQADLALFVRKLSSQSYSETDLNITYDQRMDVEWVQNGLELIGVFHPLAEKNIYFFGGVEFLSITTNITFSEGIQFQEWDGIWGAVGDSQSVSDDLTAHGFLFGGGLETPPGNGNMTTFISIQYSTSTTDEPFFGTPEFKVKVGGFSTMLGFKLYM